MEKHDFVDPFNAAFEDKCSVCGHYESNHQRGKCIVPMFNGDSPLVGLPVLCDCQGFEPDPALQDIG